MTRTLYLDLDGTLIDARKRLYNLYVDLTGSKLSFDVYWKYKREQRSNDWLLINIENYPIKGIEEFKEKWLKKIELKQYLDFDELFPNTKELLIELESSLDLILITGRQSYTNLIWQLEKYQIAHYFKRILNTANKTPKEEMIRNYTGIFQPNDIIIGDTGIEVIAGKNLGIITVAVLSGFRNKESLEKYQPDYIFSSINQLRDFCSLNN